MKLRHHRKARLWLQYFETDQSRWLRESITIVISGSAGSNAVLTPAIIESTELPSPTDIANTMRQMMRTQ